MHDKCKNTATKFTLFASPSKTALTVNAKKMYAFVESTFDRAYSLHLSILGWPASQT